MYGGLERQLTDRSLWSVEAPGFAELGVTAFTTTREAGSFAVASDEPARVVTERWGALQTSLGEAGRRLASASQVHGSTVLLHVAGWHGMLRSEGADGHVDGEERVAMAVTVADCTPVFMAHANGTTGVLHAGWRGVAAGVAEEGVRMMAQAGAPARELRVHLGPAICGSCYEVGPEVHAALTGETVSVPTPIDVRAVLRDRLLQLGVRDISVSDACTRCNRDRFFSHRGGDTGRQLAVIVRDPRLRRL
ncbi:MAG TPA: polyphenol oxidase family protein [Gemmatimonadales bacterium]|nr:polyphenol oxidase family protein [Gemmatimonadales bacterium]